MSLKPQAPYPQAPQILLNHNGAGNQIMRSMQRQTLVILESGLLMPRDHGAIPKCIPKHVLSSRPSLKFPDSIQQIQPISARALVSPNSARGPRGSDKSPGFSPGSSSKRVFTNCPRGLLSFLSFISSSPSDRVFDRRRIR